MIEATISLSLLNGLVGLLNSDSSRVPRGQFGLFDTVDRATRTVNLHFGRKRCRKFKLYISDCLPARRRLSIRLDRAGGEPGPESVSSDNSALNAFPSSIGLLHRAGLPVRPLSPSHVNRRLTQGAFCLELAWAYAVATRKLIDARMR
jgi:hypothetical protein